MIFHIEVVGAKQNEMNYPSYDLENQALELGYKYVVGVDEVGRGSLAHCVVAAAVYVPPQSIELLAGKVNDSKKLSAKKREELFPIIMENCKVGIQEISAEIIDEINILEATKLAMRGAIEQLEYFDFILVDGTVDLSKYIKGVPLRQVIKGDTLSISIAAASVVAKTIRDGLMVELHELWPLFSFNKNMGYGTKEHLGAIKLYGPTDYHRKTFGGVKEYINE